MADATETYKNHRKFVPLFHYVVLPILLVNILVAAYGLVSGVSLASVWSVLTAVALFLGALFGRVFALKVQDRVIRLEERLRLRELLPQDTRGRINELSIDQLIGLRFASDAELPDLTATVLRDTIKDRESIKKMVKSWRGDVARA
jgi:L-cystine uptake protein TcyP (sodium:dicarboxylate symporter family)